MDVFYFWKNHDADIKAGRIGYLRSTSAKVGEFNDGSPDFIWAFKPMRGTRDQLQLVARLRWADKGAVRHKAEANIAYINYDALDPQSVRYDEDDAQAAIAGTNEWAARHFPKMRAANFAGPAGQEALRGLVLGELKGLGAGMRTVPFASQPA